MKAIPLGLLSLPLALTLAGAATITVTAFDGPRSHPLSTSEGSLLAFGSISIGSFDISDSAIQASVAAWDLQKVEDNFTRFGKAIGFGFNDLSGLYQNTVSATLPKGSPLDGKPIYTVVSDGPSISTSFGLLIYRHGHDFQADPLPTEPALLGSKGGTLIVGEFGKFRKTLGPLVDIPTYSLAVKGLAIPEPRALALLAFAAGFTFRRSRST